MKQKNKNLFIMFLLGILYVGVRVIYFIHWDIQFDSDTAIFGLMAKHFMHGEYSAYFWGQNFMGSIEPLLISLLFRIFGISFYTLNFIPFLFFAIFILLNYYLINLYFNRIIAIASSLMLIFTSSYAIDFTVRTTGGYIEIMLFGSLLMLLANKIENKPSSNTIYFLLFGIIAGLGWWTNQLIICYLIPVLFYLFLKFKTIRFSFSKALLFITGFIIGYLPRFILDVSSNPVLYKVSLYKISSIPDIFNHLILLPAALSKMFGDCGPKYSNILMLIIVFVGMIKLCLHFYKNLIKTIKQKESPAQNSILFFILIVTISIFVLSPRTESAQSARYLRPLFSVIPVGISLFVYNFYKKNKYILIIPLFILLYYSNNHYNVFITQGTRRNRTISPVLNYLYDNGIKGGYADYWINYVLVFVSRENIIMSPYDGNNYYPAYTKYVESLDKIAVVCPVNKELNEIIDSRDFVVLKSTMVGDSSNISYGKRKIFVLEKINRKNS